MNEVGRSVLMAHGLSRISSYFPLGEGLVQEETIPGRVCAVDALELALDALIEDKGPQSISNLLDECTANCSVRPVRDGSALQAKACDFSSGQDAKLQQYQRYYCDVLQRRDSGKAWSDFRPGLLGVLNQPGVLLGIVGSLSSGPELIPKPPGPWHIEREWVFFVSAPALSAHAHWIFVSRVSGQTQVVSEN